MITVIADCGSTKSDWVVTDNNKICFKAQYAGLNPCIQTPDCIKSCLNQVWNGICNNIQIAHIEECGIEFHIYCAGCSTAALCVELSDILCSVTKTDANRIHVSGDLLGAARAALGTDRGIIAILGTGSASGYYDGKAITLSVPPLGYILGDEASGAFFGKCLAADYLKGLMPYETELMFQDFLKSSDTAYGTELALSTILEKTYKESFPNRFLASLVPFMAQNRNDRYVQNLLQTGFNLFFDRNINVYSSLSNRISFIGSIAVAFNKELKSVAESKGFILDKVVQYPILALRDYHNNLNQTL